MNFFFDSLFFRGKTVQNLNSNFPTLQKNKKKKNYKIFSNKNSNLRQSKDNGSVTEHTAEYSRSVPEADQGELAK